MFLPPYSVRRDRGSYGEISAWPECMIEKPSPLPPLQTLRAFESASRLGSFTRAAQDLHVSQGAISRQVHYLEQRLGVRLFVRIDRGVRLTEAGEQLAATVSDILNQLSRTTAAISGTTRRNTITIGVTSAIASLWLIPRLTGFRQANPTLDIRVLASDSDPERSAPNVDVTIEYTRRKPANLHCIHLFDERVFPVCSPAYLDKRKPPTHPSELVAEFLIQLDDSHRNWMDWPEWLRDAGSGHLEDTSQLIRINNYMALLQAASAGQGIALGWEHLVSNYLQSGALQPILPEYATSRGAFWLISAKHVPPSSAIDRLGDWLHGGTAVCEPKQTE